MNVDRPSIVFNGYFKGTISKEAELRTYTSLTDNAALSVLENEDSIYYHNKNLSKKEIRYMDNVIMSRHIIRNLNPDDSITFITVNCSRTGKEEIEHHYTYSVSVIVVKFDDPSKYRYKPAKIKKMCLDCIMEEYKKYKLRINTLRDIGFDMLKKEK
jgi:hypothetical protein